MLAVLFITISGLFYVPLSTNMYAAAPALIAPRFGTTVSGEIYQWKLWADKGTQRDSFVEQLISSSEDLRGLFQVPEISSGE